MKQAKIFILSALMAFTISGCSGIQSETKKSENLSDKTVSLTVWGSEQDQELLSEMVESFKAAYKKEADFDITLGEVDESISKVTILSNVTNTADVFAFADDQLMELAAAGVIEPVENAQKIKEWNSKASVSAASVDDVLYAYPMTADNGYFMFYNKKYLSEADVKTMDKMLETAASLNKKVTMDWSSGWYLYSFFGNTGLSLGLNDDGITNYCDWNSRTGKIKGIDVGNAMLKIANSSGFLNTDDQGLISGAESGTVIAGVSGVWSANKLQKIWGDDFAAVKLPTYTCAGNQVQMSSYSGYKMIGVNAYSKQKNWAAKLAEWITNEENQTLRFETRGQAPSNERVAESEMLNQSQAIQALIAQAEFSSLQRVGNNYWSSVEEFGKKLINNKVSKENMQNQMDILVKGITLKIVD